MSDSESSHTKRSKTDELKNFEMKKLLYGNVSAYLTCQLMGAPFLLKRRRAKIKTKRNVAASHRRKT
jgi:hypothetical protein